MTTLSKTEITDKETQIEVVLDQVIIRPITKSIIVKTMKKYLNVEDGVLRIAIGDDLIYVDRDVDLKAGIEASTAYTDFLNDAGIDLDKIKAAI